MTSMGNQKEGGNFLKVLVIDESPQFYQKLLKFKQGNVHFSWMEPTCATSLSIAEKSPALILYHPNAYQPLRSQIKMIKNYFPNTPVIVATSENWSFLQAFEWSADGHLCLKKSADSIRGYLFAFLRARGLIE